MHNKTCRRKQEENHFLKYDLPGSCSAGVWVASTLAGVRCCMIRFRLPSMGGGCTSVSLHPIEECYEVIQSKGNYYTLSGPTPKS